jgi:hypothetical protein
VTFKVNDINGLKRVETSAIFAMLLMVSSAALSGAQGVQTDYVGVVTPNACNESFPGDHVLKLVGAASGVLYIFAPKFAPGSDEWKK